MQLTDMCGYMIGLKVESYHDLLLCLTFRPHNYVDFAVDENGLWAIYAGADSETMRMAKIEPSLFVVNIWNVEVNTTEIADSFIMCGVWYGLKSANNLQTQITHAYDLFR